MKYLLSLCFFLAASLVMAQDSEVLFTIDSHEVHTEEFKYIYQKNNPHDARPDVDDILEYLELYINFKLKVTRARELQIDTIASLSQELKSYRDQLSRTFLMNREVIGKLTQELFERKQQDVEVSHVLVAVSREAPEEEVEKARKKALEMREQLKKADSFSDFARKHSEDPSVERNGGNIGFITAPLPNGFYHFETAIYENEVGELSEPVRSPMGFHILKANERRPAKGEVEVAQILIRSREQQSGSDDAAIEKLSDAITELQKGVPFSEVAREYSEDASTAQRGGYIGFIGINLFDPAFETAAFGLEEDGDYSAPVRSRIGYHIIQRLSKRPIDNFEEMEPILKQKIEDSERKDIVLENLVKSIKEDAGYFPQKEVLDTFISGLSSEVFTYRWRVPEDLEDGVLFKIGEKPYFLSEFAEHLRRNTRQRLRMSTDTDIRKGVMQIYEDYVGDAAIRYHEARLAETHPEFRALIREYEEGILLFEINRMKVWDKATQDTSGLRAFYERNIDRYMTDPAAKVVHFTIKNANERRAERVHSRAQTTDIESLIERFDGRRGMEISTEEERLTKSGLPESLNYEENFLSELTKTEDGHYRFSIVKELIEPEPRGLDRARGFVIADYQERLEKEWMLNLNRRYEVEVNQQALGDLIIHLIE